MKISRGKTMILSAVLLVLLLAACFTGCAGTETQGPDTGGDEAGGFPLTITDDLGNQVTFEMEPEKIVSLSPANTEILFALGQGGKLVGRTNYCNYPVEAAQIPTIGDFNGPNLEKIISLMPDLVMATDFIQDDVRGQLEGVGIKVIVYNAQSIDAVILDLEKTGEITGAQEEAQSLISVINEKRKAVSEAVKAAQEEPLSVFVDIGDFYSAGEGSLLGSLLSELGMKNIAADTGLQWPQMPVESIIAADPDIYVSFYAKPQDIEEMDGLKVVGAVKNHKIIYYEMLSPESDLIQRPGPRIAEGLERLAKDMIPEAFE